MGANGQVREPGEIGQQMVILGEIVGKLHEVVSQLQTTLSPILANDDEVKDLTTGPVPSPTSLRSPLGQMLEEKNADLQGATRRLDYLLGKIRL
jgi:hypothetical protein